MPWRAESRKLLASPIVSSSGTCADSEELGGTDGISLRLSLRGAVPPVVLRAEAVVLGITCMLKGRGRWER